MKACESTPSSAKDEEISALIEALLATEQRLEALTAGEVDTVAGRDGRTFLLRRAQEQLRHSEAAKQAAILNALPAHIALLDSHGFIISVNEAWTRFGKANGFRAVRDGIGLNYLDVCDRVPGGGSAEAYQVAAGIRAVLGGSESSFSIEYPCHSPKERRWFQLTVTPLTDDRSNGAVVMHLNITARKLAAVALEDLSLKTERRERILNSGLSSMSDFAQIYDGDGRLLFVNQPLLTLWGRTLEEVVGKNFFDLGYPDELATKLQRQLQEVLETRQSITDETPFISATGTNGFYEYIFSPVFAADGAVDLVVGSTRDITERKRSEAALRQSEFRYRSLFENMLEGYAYCETVFEQDYLRDFIYLEVNRAFETSTGLKNVVGKKVTQLIPGIRESSADIFEIYSRVALTGKSERFESCLESLGIWLSITVYSPERTRLVAVFENITIRKQAELEIFRTNQALRESNEKFHQLADNIADAFWIRSPDMSEVQYISPAFERIWGRSMESLYANPHEWADFIFPEDRERVQAAFAGLTGNAPSLDIEYRIVRPDGDIRWIRVRGSQVRNTDDKLIRHTGIVTDITEQKRASALLIESEQRLTLATESARIGIWDWDVVTNTLVWDAQMYALYGIREQDFSGAYNAWQKGLHPEDRERSEAEINAAVHGVNGFHFEFRVLWPNGEVRHIEAHAQVLRATDGSTAHMIGVNWDITERKLAEIRVETLHKQLEDASRRAGMAEVATGVLHNVGNVLNSVNISTSLVVERLQNSSVSRLTDAVKIMSDHAGDLTAFLTLDERGRRLPAFLMQLAPHLDSETRAIAAEMQSVAENIDHIKEIVNAQQRYAGTFGVLEALDLRESIHDALRIQAGSLNRHNVETVRNLEPINAVVVDKHKVLQILVNLISNADHAMTDSPVKTLTIRTHPAPDGGIQLSIADTGCGINAENITRLFGHGFTTKKDGHGFGLHSSALAAKEMNARLTAQSDGVGHGAIFTLVFPPATTQPPDRQSAAANLATRP